MGRKHKVFIATVVLFLLGYVGCQQPPSEPVPGLKAFVGAQLFDGTGNDLIQDAVLIVQDGRIQAAGPAESTTIPEGAERIDLSGSTVIPGLFNAHGHVGTTKGLQSGSEHYTKENILDHLGLYARYGVTTVLSLGGGGPKGVEVRNSQDTPELDRARLYLSGPVVEAQTPEEAREQVKQLAAMDADFVKIRVDDNLGTREKMPPAVYEAVIDQAHEEGLRVAAHIYYLEDAKALIRSDVDFIAHSVRDKEVDEELISLLKENEICLCPTLVREVSTFVYETRPEFFDDPFFLRDADPDVITQLEDAEYQKQIKSSKSAQMYKKALEVASKNLKILADAGVSIAFGTDSGPPARFQGYFEHMEMDLMAKAGLTPKQILLSATSQAARCLQLDDNLGTLETGKWADFVVLAENPLEDSRNAHSIESVWIAGNSVPDSDTGTR